MSSEVDAISFRRACSRFATGITIATVLDPEGVPQGFTANSFTSVSADPALVLICVDRRANVLPHFKAGAGAGPFSGGGLATWHGGSSSVGGSSSAV